MNSSTNAKTNKPGMDDIIARNNIMVIIDDASRDLEITQALIIINDKSLRTNIINFYSINYIKIHVILCSN